MCQSSLARLTYVSLNSLYPFLSEMSPINELRYPKSINHHAQLQPTKYLAPVLLPKQPKLSKFSEILNASVNQIQWKPLYNLARKI